MNSEFNERMFEFCYNSRLIDLLERMDYSVMPPYSPTQRIEARLGFDAMLEITTSGFNSILILQHKISEFDEIKKSSRKTSLPAPFLRFKITGRKYSGQHDLLVDLEEMGFCTCYCAPRFAKNIELTRMFQNKSILNESIYVSPKKITITNDDNHHYCFTPDGSQTEVRSEKQIVRPYNDILEIIHNSRQKTITEDFLKSSAEHLLAKLNEEKIRYPVQKFQDLNPLDQIDYIIRRIIRANWYVFKSPE